MIKYYYKKTRPFNRKLFFRYFGAILAILGLFVTIYIFFPVIAFEVFISPALASQPLAVPIPQTKLLTPATIRQLLVTQSSALLGVDYTHASSWFPAYVPPSDGRPRIPAYQLSIPRLNIKRANVSTIDDDLSMHLVNFQGTCVPPDKGNCVIFGHSTLPSLYSPKDYKTIFANIQNLRVGDLIIVHIAGLDYIYKIFDMSVVSADNTSVLSQTMDDSYLTIITCTPPGTVWFRLIIKSRLEKL